MSVTLTFGIIEISRLEGNLIFFLGFAQTLLYTCMKSLPTHPSPLDSTPYMKDLTFEAKFSYLYVDIP